MKHINTLIGLLIAAGLFINFTYWISKDVFTKMQWEGICEYCVEDFLNNKFSDTENYRRYREYAVTIQRLLQDQISCESRMARIKQELEAVSDDSETGGGDT